jgi:DNA-binding HxlR family transcriptional regulator
MGEQQKMFQEFEKLRKLTSKKWTYPVLHLIVRYPKKFNKLKQLLPGITASILSKLLDHLEKNNLLYKEDDLYNITSFGESIINRAYECIGELTTLMEKQDGIMTPDVSTTV